MPAIDVPARVQFPDTFKNPGDTAPIANVVVTNTGDTPLHIAQVALDGDEQYSLVDPVEPVDIAGHGDHTFRVKFAPTSIGPNRGATLIVTSDDAANPMAETALDGLCITREVMFRPRSIDFGLVAIGGLEVQPHALEVTSLDDEVPYTIAGITSDDGQFFVTGANGVPLAPSRTETFDVVFAPQIEGAFEARAHLYLDQDPDAHAVATLHGTAVAVDIHGGGCNAGGGSGFLIGLAALALRRRSRC